MGEAKCRQEELGAGGAVGMNYAGEPRSSAAAGRRKKEDGGRLRAI
jgi:hypothetical protein